MTEHTPTTDSAQESAQLDFLSELVQRAIQAGADDAEAMRVASDSLSVSWRDGKMESVEQATSIDLGLRVFIGKKQASISTTDIRKDSVSRLIEQVIAMAKAVPEDPFCGLAEGEAQPAPDSAALELYDPTPISPAELTDLARETFEATMAVPGVTQCESSDAGAGSSLYTLVNSHGFSATMRRSSFGLSTVAIAGTGTEMTTGSDYTSTIFREDMSHPAAIGEKAGLEAVKSLGARKMPTGQVPVVFDPRVARSLLGDLAGAISGSSIARGTSFLKDRMGAPIFPANVTIIDDPFRVRGLRSRPFDSEGIIPTKRKIIDQGRLTSWFLDLRSARKLGLESTGHAVSGPGGVPSPSITNFYMEAGIPSPDDLIKDIKNGFYVTEIMGDGINSITGDASLGAQGFWIENGIITFPVHEMTIAGNLKDIFLNLTPASDLTFRYGINAPTLRIEGMMVAGT